MLEHMESSVGGMPDMVGAGTFGVISAGRPDMVGRLPENASPLYSS